MSDFTVVHDISDTILKILKKDMHGLIPQDRITLSSPADIEADTSPHLSVFLYQIAENPHLKNQQLQKIDHKRLQYPPLPLNLFYLLTAHAQNHESEQRILGRVMQIFYDHSSISGSLLQGDLAGTFEQLEMVLHPLAIDDMNKLWNMFGNKAYKLSIMYMVSTAMLDSTREIDVDRVAQRVSEYKSQKKH